jgi:uncharacterized protein with HEPN domain
MPRDDRAPGFLWEMRDFALEVVQTTARSSVEEYVSDHVVRRSVERSLELIAEAAKQVSADFREAHPEIPWRSIIGLRNVLAHQYGRVDALEVWRVATVEVPLLLERLAALLPPTE